MKKSVLYALACVLPFTGCKNESPIDRIVNEKLYPVQFGVALKKEVANFPVTRSMPALDIPEPVISKTDPDPDTPPVVEIQDLCSQIEYFVYKKENNFPALYKHKRYTPDEIDFGIVYDTLPQGDYQFYFLAHSSAKTELSGSNLSFDKISDTFYTSLARTIDPAEIIAEDISLRRIVSKIEFKAIDTIPAVLKQFNISVTGRPEQLDLFSGEGVANNTTPYILSHTFTPEEVGKKDNIHSFYTFLPPEQGKLSASLKALDQSESLIRERTVKDIEPKANKVIRYSGRLYSRSESDNTFQLSIFENGAWSDTTTVDLPEYDVE